MIDGVELETCEECSAQTLCVLIAGHTFICLGCVCQAFGVATPPGPYTPWKLPLPGVSGPSPTIDWTSTISPELETELADAMARAQNEHGSAKLPTDNG